MREVLFPSIDREEDVWSFEMHNQRVKPMPWDVTEEVLIMNNVDAKLRGIVDYKFIMTNAVAHSLRGLHRDKGYILNQL